MDNQHPTFQGAYVREIKEALVASAVSGVHALLVSPPGTGKTEIARRAAEAITGQEHVFIRLAASTPPEKVEGSPKIEKMMHPPYTLERTTEGTIYDPEAKIIILDEAGRPHLGVFDLLLDGLNRQDISYDTAPTFWSTANFMPDAERVEAFKDRIGFWVHVKVGKIDVDAVAGAHLDALGTDKPLSIGDDLPEWSAIEEVRKMHVTENSRKAVIDVIRTLDEEANNSEQPFLINNRRVEQWQRMLFRVSAYHYGSNDFGVVHSKAAQQVKWMWPAANYEEHRKWFEITSSIADPVGAAISAVQALAFEKFEKIAATSSKNELTINLGTAIAEAERNLTKLGIADPRIDDVLGQLQKAYAKIVNGEDPF